MIDSHFSFRRDLKAHELKFECYQGEQYFVYGKPLDEEGEVTNGVFGLMKKQEYLGKAFNAATEELEDKEETKKILIFVAVCSWIAMFAYPPSIIISIIIYAIIHFKYDDVVSKAQNRVHQFYETGRVYSYINEYLESLSEEESNKYMEQYFTDEMTKYYNEFVSWRKANPYYSPELYAKFIGNMMKL